MYYNLHQLLPPSNVVAVEPNLCSLLCRISSSSLGDELDAAPIPDVDGLPTPRFALLGPATGALLLADSLETSCDGTLLFATPLPAAVSTGSVFVDGGVAADPEVAGGGILKKF